MKPIYDSIYEPAEDSFLIIDCIKKFINKNQKKGIKKLDSALDMGTGSGVIAEELIKTQYFRKVIAVDKNLKVVNFGKDSFSDIPNLKFVQSDLFKNIPIQKFDLITFNPPYLPEDEEFYDPALHGGEKGWEIIEEFLKQVGPYLEKDGKIFLLFSTLTNKKKVEELIKQNDFDFKKVGEEKLSFEKLFVYELISNKIFLAKGKRGYVYTDGKYAIKERNPNSSAGNTIKNEITFLIKLNKKNIGPKLKNWDKKNFSWFKYYYIEGEFILDFISKNKKESIKKILIELMKQCKIMDELGINKFEMNHPHKHVIVDGGLGVWLIDFERARETENPKNVTQTIQFILSLGNMLKEKGIDINRKKMIELSKKYKNFDASVDDKQNNKQKVFKSIIAEIQ